MLQVDPESPFSLENLPFGIFSVGGGSRRVGVAIGDHVVDVHELAQRGAFDEDAELKAHVSVFSSHTLNAFAALGRPLHQKYRLFIRDLLVNSAPALNAALLPRQEVKMHLPMAIGDYTDFYAAKNHAYNLGVMFRGPENALQPNYLHLPVGYHGRASSVTVAPDVRRPTGQILPLGEKVPILSACRKLDIELEMAAFICTPNTQGTPIDIKDASQHIFGFVLMNDWSARDIQAWEYVPLGPFNSKNFATTISPWVVLADALEPYRVASPDAPENLLPYLQGEAKAAYDIPLSVDLVVGGETHHISSSNTQYLSFSFEQMVAHHTVGGCPMQTGDLLGSGTISGKDRESLGSLIELSRNGKEPLQLGGQTRTFLEDGDEVIISGTTGPAGKRVGFGPCRGRILPAR